MSARVLPLLVIAAWAGATLALSSSRRIRRPTLVARLRPYQPLTGRTLTGRPLAGGSGGAAGSTGRPVGFATAATEGAWRRTFDPLVTGAAQVLTRLLGDSARVEDRLARAGLPADPVAFRSRQALSTVASCAVVGTVAGALRAPALASLAVTVAAGTAAFLFQEQRLIDSVARRQEQFMLELPVVAEQLGMLLGAGWSLGSAMNRLAERGQGVVAGELATVCGRIRHGLAEGEALAEWAARTDIVALGRLVDVLAMDRHTSDVGRLIAEEARSMRRDSHRRLLEQIERRSQAVWVPVTVAALVPGLLFLAVPFVDALRLFSAG